MSKKIILAGQRFGKWQVLAEAPSRIKPCGESSTYSLCQCDCGFIGEVANCSLRGGISRSCVKCGLLSGADERATHGHCRVPNRTRTYRIWGGMKSRCTNPHHQDWKHYGAKGVSMHKPWFDSYEVFLADMGECPAGLSIDRWPNKAGNYEPGNVRWANQIQQMRNTLVNRIETVRGVTACVAELIERFQVNSSMVQMRLHRGWPAELAFFAPKNAKLKSLLSAQIVNG